MLLLLLTGAEMQTVPVRLSEGLYEAVKELSKKLDVDKSDMATLLMWAGISSVKSDLISESARSLMWADSMEASVAIVRAVARLDAAKKEQVNKALGELFSKIVDIFNKPSLEAAGLAPGK